MTSKEKELISKIGEAAYQSEKTYTGCSQAVLGGFKEVLGDKIISDEVFTAGCGLCGGAACCGNVCGAITGGLMVLSLFTGRTPETWDDEDKMFTTFKLGQELVEDFKSRYWSMDCRGIQEKIMGRAYNFNFEDELNAFIEAGGHETKCPEVVQNAAKKVTEILIREKLVDAEKYL